VFGFGPPLMQHHFAVSIGNVRRRAISPVVSVLLLCSALRAQEVCPVEISVLLSPSTTKSVIASLRFERETRSQVYFFDTDNLGLLKQGVILRVRQGARNDLTIKVGLPDGDKQADSSNLRGHFGCEIDRTGTEASTSFSAGQKYKRAPVPTSGKDIFKALNSHQQRLLLDAHVSIDWSLVRRIANIESTTWETTSQSQFPKLTLEYWEWPGGNILELSARVPANESGSKSSELQQLAIAKGLSLSADQGAKTSQVLKMLMPEAFSGSTQSQTPSQGTTNPLAAGVDLVQLLERKSLVFPDLATVRGPLSSWEKFKLAANDSVALSTVGAALVGGAYGQAIDSPSGYGQGASGYGKRVGSGMARSASDNLFGTFLLASILHEDPRFYVKRDLSFKQAVKYGAVRLVLTRSDSGRPVVNYAGLLGPLAGEALANTYWPEQNRGVGSILVRYTSDLGWRFGGNLLRQYWPQLNRRLRLAPSGAKPDISQGEK
jgi:hypothetical protein